MTSDWSIRQESASGMSWERPTVSDIHFPMSTLQYSVGGCGEDCSEIRSQSDSDHHVVRDSGGDQIPDPGAVSRFLPQCSASLHPRPDFDSPWEASLSGSQAAADEGTETSWAWGSTGEVQNWPEASALLWLRTLKFADKEGRKLAENERWKVADTIFSMVGNLPTLFSKGWKLAEINNLEGWKAADKNWEY